LPSFDEYFRIETRVPSGSAGVWWTTSLRDYEGQKGYIQEGYSLLTSWNHKVCPSHENWDNGGRSGEKWEKIILLPEGVYCRNEIVVSLSNSEP